jgi:hypothetical protein
MIDHTLEVELNAIGNTVGFCLLVDVNNEGNAPLCLVAPERVTGPRIAANLGLD